MASESTVIAMTRSNMVRRRIKLARRRTICKLPYDRSMPDRQLLLQTATTFGYVGQLVELNLQPVGLPAFLLPTLVHIRDREPVSPSEISAAAGVPMTTLRDNVRRLVDRKLSAAHAEPGRRALVSPAPHASRTGRRRVGR